MNEPRVSGVLLVRLQLSTQRQDVVKANEAANIVRPVKLLQWRVRRQGQRGAEYVVPVRTIGGWHIDRDVLVMHTTEEIQRGTSVRIVVEGDDHLMGMEQRVIAGQFAETGDRVQ